MSRFTSLRQHLALANRVARGRRLDDPAGDRDINHAGIMRLENGRRGDMIGQRHDNDNDGGRDDHRRQQPSPRPKDVPANRGQVEKADQVPAGAITMPAITSNGESPRQSLPRRRPWPRDNRTRECPARSASGRRPKPRHRPPAVRATARGSERSAGGTIPRKNPARSRFKRACDC